jgi:CO/xanthine dehydrogenase Mo-binding subunit
VPEHKVRVVAPDIGGSFGMKSAIYNEVPLVLLASKKLGRPVKWMSTRSEAFLSDAMARDNVTNAELALDKDGTFLAFRVMSTVNAGAYLQSASRPTPATSVRWPASTGLPRCTWNRRRCSRTPSRCGPIAATDGRKPPT